MTGTPDRPNPSDFGTEIRAAVHVVRQAFSESLAAIGLDAAVPLHVARSLGIDKSLSWKVCRIVTEPDPALVAARLPGKSGIRIVERALRRAGAPDDTVGAIGGAVNQFRAVETRHAGDRETLAAMLAGSSASHRREEAERKRSFLGNSATWGVRARLQISSQYLAPSHTPGKTDTASVSGFIGFQRLRNDLPWSIANVSLNDDRGRPQPADQFSPIDPDGMTPDGVPLLPEYCTAPLPAMKLARLRHGAVRLLVGEAPVGKAGEFDVLAGWTMRGVLPMYRSAQDAVGSHTTALSTPVELLIHDLFIHRSLTFAMNPRPFIYSQLPSGPLFPGDGHDAGLMRLACGVEQLGSPPDVTTPQFAPYSRLVKRAMEQLGGSMDDYVGYRLRLRYPPIPATSVLRHELADPPAES